ncbi:MAG: PASTA domain-containing protein [Actinomycetia bacterium]|nr:PASTA domain-containing protein [Actinomycetes bacterium]
MATTRTDRSSPLVLDGRYRLVAQLGTGGSAHVYLADDLRLRRRVAVKVLQPALLSQSGFIARFEHEARSSASFSHPHVVAVHDWGESEIGPFLVTEYLGGGSLHGLIAAGHLLTPAQAVKVALEATSGLSAAHQRGMVHRDVKPANLLFDRGGRLRVADFGLVQVLGDTGLTEPDSAVLGTLRYAAPERSRPGTADGRTDVYSLAVSLVEAVTGEVPGPSDDPIELLAYRCLHPLVVPDDFGAAAEPLRRAGSVEVDERPTAIELMRDLVTATEDFEAPGALPLAGALLNVDALDSVDPDSAQWQAPVSDKTLPVTGSEPTTPAESFADLGIEVFDDDRIERFSPDDGAVEPRRQSAGATSSRRGWWLSGAAVVLAAVVAATMYSVSTVETPATPLVELGNLRGETIADVRTLSEANDWVLDEEQVRSDKFDKGTVIRQSPSAGSQIPAGFGLSVDVVIGPRLTMVPWLVGLDVAAATKRLESRDFGVVSREPRFDEVVSVGVVMQATIDGDLVEPGRLLEPGVSFDLVVSSGPVPRAVPDLVGRTREEAAATLAQLRLGLTEAEPQFSETDPDGTVISQSISPSIEVARDTIVSITVSKGPDRRSVPDVSGMTIEEATAALEAVGLERASVAGGGNIVEETDPKPGTLLKPGASVDFWAPR